MTAYEILPNDGIEDSQKWPKMTKLATDDLLPQLIEFIKVKLQKAFSENSAKYNL